MSSTSRINFFIVGAAKGGTTTAFERLNNRDDVYLSPLKEPNFYSTDIDIEKFSTEFKANTRLDLSDYFENDPLEVRQIGFSQKRIGVRSTLYASARIGKGYRRV